jgi:proteasome lid subunit RPN8/RPN11
MCTRIKIKDRTLREMVNHGAAHLPYESCGILLGQAICEEWVIYQFQPVDNIAEHKEIAFLMNPQQLIPCLYSQSPLQAIGIVHTHPTQPPIPSHADMNVSWSLTPTQWIISYIDRSQPEVACYRFAHTGVHLEFHKVVIDIVQTD